MRKSGQLSYDEWTESDLCDQLYEQTGKKEADPENEDDFVLEEINLDEVEPEDMTGDMAGDIVEDITKVISVGDLTPEKIREEMEESE